MNDEVVFSARWQRGVKAFTYAAVAWTLGAVLVADWDPLFGPNHCFSSVRPALRSALNAAFGYGGGSAPADAAAAAGARSPAAALEQQQQQQPVKGR